MAILAASLSCGVPETRRPSSAKPLTDPTRQPEYRAAIERLHTLNTEARQHYAAGRRKEAAALVNEGEEYSKQLLAANRPSLSAMEAVSDRDALYADMLFANRHFGHARQMYQRNVARWKHWRPQTDASRQRLADAEAAISRCDQAIAAQ